MKNSISTIVITIILFVIGLFLCLVPSMSGEIALETKDGKYIGLVDSLEGKYLKDIESTVMSSVMQKRFATDYKHKQDSVKQLRALWKLEADSLFKARKADEARMVEARMDSTDQTITNLYLELQEKHSLAKLTDQEKVALKKSITDTLTLEKYYENMVSSKLGKKYVWADFVDKDVKKQSSGPFLLAGFSLILIALIFILYSNKNLPLNKMGAYAGIAVLVSILVIYSSSQMYSGIEKDVEYKEQSRTRELDVRDKLFVIRDAQKQYKKHNKKFAKDFDVLIGWLKNDSIASKKRVGDITDTINVAVEIITMVPVLEEVFPSDKYPNLNVHELANIPHGIDGAKFKMTASTIEKNGVVVPVFEVSTKKIAFLEDIILENFDKESIIKLGDLNKASYNGNWSE